MSKQQAPKGVKVIAISGKAEHGKDTVFDIICKANIQMRVPFAVRRIAFGDCVKICATYLGWDGDKENNRTPLTDVGQYGRSLDKEVWVKHGYESMNDYVNSLWRIKPQDILFVVTDMRFKAELEALKRDFGDNLFTIRVNRPVHTSKLSEAQLKDISEVDLDDEIFDYHIDNTDLTKLDRDIRNVYDEITQYFKTRND